MSHDNARQLLTVATLIGATAWLTSCKSGEKSEAAPAEMSSSSMRLEGDSEAGGEPAATAPAAPGPLVNDEVSRDAEKEELPRRANYASEQPRGGKDGEKKNKDAVEGATSRAWFPETFLFEPLVRTDDRGLATLSARVPDRLTTWRVLALAHSRAGAQAGALARFTSTLPVYVEPIVPKRLVAGDKIRVPLQLVNTTNAEVTAPLTVTARGATIGPVVKTVTIGAGQSRIEAVELSADAPGEASLTVALGASDSVTRTFSVAPTGRAVVVTHQGTLAAPRTLETAAVAEASSQGERATLTVFPGALAILRTELGACISRAGVAEDAYALLLAGRAPELLAAFGDEADPAALRELSLITTQRAMRHARNLSIASATLLVEAALAHPQNAALERLGERAAGHLTTAQLPDGTFSLGEGATLQRVLVATAEAIRAIDAGARTPAAKKRANAVSVRAAAAFERNLRSVEDGYTAAAILASGAVRGKSAETLRATLLAALVETTPGARALPVASGVVRADGEVPSLMEATALAALALADTPGAPLPELGATLLGGYSLLGGWGDGRTNLVALRAALRLFREPLPAGIQITLTMDDKVVASGALSKDKLRELLVLEASIPVGGAAHKWRIAAEPAVPGLGFVFRKESRVPWRASPPGGLELRAPAAIRGQVGEPVVVELVANAPSGEPLAVRYAVPAGVQPDRPGLEAARGRGELARFSIDDEAVTLEPPPLAPGALFTFKLRLVPTLAGTLHAEAPSVTIARTGQRAEASPPVWTIAP